MNTNLPTPGDEGKKTVFGVANSRLQANRIVDHLANAGFTRDHISVVLPEAKEGRSETALAANRSLAHAARIGLAVGGTISWLVGWDAFTAPGFGHLVAAGPVGAILTGAAAGSGAGRRVRRALVGLGLRRKCAELYRDQVKEGQILVSLETSNWREAEAARKIFLAMGAANVAIGGSKASGLLAREFVETAHRLETSPAQTVE